MNLLVESEKRAALESELKTLLAEKEDLKAELDVGELPETLKV